MSNLKVRRGNEWITISGMPTVSSSDNGKSLIVENGEWVVSKIQSESTTLNTPDWSQNDETANDYIKNRTHWLEQEASQKFQSILDNEIYNFSNAENISFARSNLPAGTLKQNQKYRVIIQGTDSIYTAQKVELDSFFPFIYIGNLSLIDTTQINTGEPFLLISIEEEYGNYEDGNLIILAGTITTAAMSLLKVVNVPAVVHPLRKEFLPIDSQADWNENDSTSINFIQNRTHWEDIETITTSYQYNDNPLTDNTLIIMGEAPSQTKLKKISNDIIDLELEQDKYCLFITQRAVQGEYTQSNFFKLNNENNVYITKHDWGQTLKIDHVSTAPGNNASLIAIADANLFNYSYDSDLEEGLYFEIVKSSDITIDDVTYETIVYPINLIKQVTQPIYHTIPHKFLPEYYIMKDVKDKQSYVVYIKNGILISEPECDSIEVTTMPNKIYYPNGEEFSPAGMVVTLKYKNGETREITDYTYTTEKLTHGILVHIIYDSYIPLTTTIEVGIDDYVDFIYKDNGDGTFTILDWKGTYLGEPNEYYCFLPDSEDAILPY